MAKSEVICMKFKKVLLASTMILMFSVTPSWAKGNHDYNDAEKVAKAPEINAKSGTNAIAIVNSWIINCS
ncbi:MAG: hypothetical protein ACXVA0_24990 [Mucilaginibacter sp.]